MINVGHKSFLKDYLMQLLYNSAKNNSSLQSYQNLSSITLAANKLLV